MKDPTRWADGGDAPGDLAALLKGARDDVPTQEELKAVAAALGPALGGSAGSGAGATGTSGAAAGATGAVSGPIVVLGVVAACALAGGGLYALVKSSAPEFSHAPTPTTPIVVPAAPSVSAPSQPQEPETTAEEPSASAAPEPVKPAPTASKGPSEAELLRRAQQLVQTNPAQALALTREHQRRFPNGALSQEREVIAIEALKKLGNEKAAKEKSGEFEKSYPGSAHIPKVETLKPSP